MEAKDTIMSDEQLDNIGYPILPIGDRTGSRMVAKAQAEISFKAGQQSVIDLALKLHILCKGDNPHNTACRCKEFWEEVIKDKLS